MGRRKPTAIVQLGLRLPESLRQEIARAAKANGRPMNTEVIARLRYSFQLPAVHLLLKAAVEGRLPAEWLEKGPPC